MIGKQFNILINHALNQYILSQYKLSHKQVHWVRILAEYATNFVYNPGHMYSAPNALFRIPMLSMVGKPSSLLKSVHQAKKISTDKEFLHVTGRASNPTSEFSLNQGLIVKLIQGSSPIFVAGDASLIALDNPRIVTHFTTREAFRVS